MTLQPPFLHIPFYLEQISCPLVLHFFAGAKRRENNLLYYAKVFKTLLLQIAALVTLAFHE